MKKRLAVWVLFVVISLMLSLDPGLAPSLLAQHSLKPNYNRSPKKPPNNRLFALS